MAPDPDPSLFPGADVFPGQEAAAGKPSQPTGLTAQPQAEAIQLSWNANPEPGVEYRVYLLTP